MQKQKKITINERFSNKVFQTWAYLNVAERKRLQKFVDSPYFNTSKTLSRLCEVFNNLHELEQTGFDRAQVWQQICPGEPYDDVNFRKYCSDLLGLVEGFMAQEVVMQNGDRRAIDALQFVAQRKVEPLFNGVMRDARQQLEKRNYRTLDYYKYRYLMERQYYYMMDFDVKVNVRSNIEEISHHLDIFFLIEKLKLYCSILSQRKTGSEKYNIGLVDEVLQFLKQFPIEEAPELALYYYSYLTLSDGDNTDHYYNMRRMMEKYGPVMPRNEAVEMYDSALHYCTGKLNMGNRIFLQEYFDLFEIAIKQGIFLQQGELAQWRFNNIVGVALRLGKLDWAENFVETYKGYLNASTRENTYTFNLARVYRYQHKYKKVLILLQSVEYEDIIYSLISKAILVITYYELDEVEALDSYLESFRVFLNRNKNAPYQKHHLNLIKYVRKITRLSPGDKAGVQQIRADILREKETTVNHDWLLEKLDELG